MPAYDPQTFAWDVSSQTWPDAYEHYRSSMTELYEISDLAPSDRATFYSSTSVTLFEAGVIGRGRSVGQTMDRSQALARRSGVDSVSLIFNRSPLITDINGRSVRGEPGAIHLRDLSRPSISRVAEVDVINLMVPRDLVPSGLLDPDAHGHMLSGAAGAGRLLASHLSVLAEVASGLNDAEGEAAIQAALLIADRSLGRTASLTAGQKLTLYRSIRRAAGQTIERGLQDPAMTVDDIARSAGVSRTTLYRAFGEQGGVLQYIQTRRLEQARQALHRRVGARPTIADIAYQYGFASPSHFNRLFRARFGHAPSEIEPLRESASRAAAGPSDMIAHDRAIDWLRHAGAR